MQLDPFVQAIAASDFLKRVCRGSPVHAEIPCADDGWAFVADVIAAIESYPFAPPRLRLVANGVGLPAERWLRRPNSRGERWPDRGIVASEVRAGATLVFDRLEEVDQGVAALAHVIGWHVGDKVQVNAYLALTNSTGFPVHWDDHDVVVVQLFGAKTWEIWPPTREFPMRKDLVENAVPPTGEPMVVNLENGSLLHVPRGWWHRAVSSSGGSLHLTLGFTRRTGIDWATSLVDELYAESQFRSDYPSSSSAGEKRIWERDHLALLFERFEASVGRPGRTFGGRRPHLELISVPTAADQVGNRAVRLLSRYPLEISSTDDLVSFRLGSRTVMLDRAAHALIELLNEPHDVPFATLRDHAGISTRALFATVDALAQKSIVAWRLMAS